MHRQDDRRWSRRRFLTSSCAVTTGLVTGAFGRTVSSALATPPDPIAGPLRPTEMRQEQVEAIFKKIREADIGHR